jgi:predicted 3-demethylubiquinone-9 3-methyltransferase (glyoxalase superfamily)
MAGMTLCLWFDGLAEQAAAFYAAAFRDAGRAASVGNVVRVGPSGAALTVEFTLEEQRLLGLNGGPHYRPTPATSLIVDCADQEEIDHFWGRLSAGGATSRCGWLTDRFGFSWQVVPRDLATMMRSPDAARRSAVMAALMTMEKLDRAALRAAHDGAA